MRALLARKPCVDRRFAQSTRPRAARIGCDSGASTSMGFAWVGVWSCQVPFLGRVCSWFGFVPVRSAPRSLPLKRRGAAEWHRVPRTMLCSALLCSSGFTGVARRGLSLGVLTHARTRPCIPIAMYGPYAVGTSRGHYEQYAHCLPAAPPIGAALSQACRSRCAPVPCARVCGRRAAIGSRAIAAAVVVGKCSA